MELSQQMMNMSAWEKPTSNTENGLTTGSFLSLNILSGMEVPAISKVGK